MGKLLVVDDDESLVSIFELMISGYGHEVVTAGCGKDGIKTFDLCRWY